MDEFAQSQSRFGARKVMHWRQILLQQIPRQLDGFNN